METNILETVGQIGGIGGISLGVFLILFRDLIGKKIFPQLTKQQAYKLLVLLSILIWLLTGTGLVLWMRSGEKNISQFINDGGQGMIHAGTGDIELGNKE
jgi:hypothetical protein